jgi:hypothetical protein
MGVPIPHTPDDVTAEWLDAALKQSGALRTASVASVEKDPIGVGVGLLGDLLRVEPLYAGDDDADAPSVIVKIPTHAPQNKAIGMAFRFYEREIRFYRELAPSAKVRVPRCWYADMDLEIESHLAMRTDDLIRAGLAPDTAREEAIRRFGDFEEARRQLHAAARQRESAMRQRDWRGSLVRDLRFALRQARRAPGFTALAVATLALGIGATTTMFTLVENILLHPLPYPNPEQLVAVTGLDSARNSVPTISSADWLDWRRASSLLGSAIYSYPIRQGIIISDSATRVSAERVSGNFFDVLKPEFVAGRAFTEQEAQSSALVAVISEGLWRRMFSADPHLAAPLRTSSRSAESRPEKGSSISTTSGLGASIRAIATRCCSPPESVCG